MIPAGWGNASGRKFDIEVKREGFNPRRLRGKAREHLDRQLGRLRETNANGGYGFWARDASEVIHALVAVHGVGELGSGDFDFRSSDRQE
jgi:hypothetical protein